MGSMRLELAAEKLIEIADSTLVDDSLRVSAVYALRRHSSSKAEEYIDDIKYNVFATDRMKRAAK